jgi:phage I-like protein
MHITLGSAVSNPEIRNRVGEQASAARSLRKLIVRMEDSTLKDLEAMLEELDESFQALEVQYTYVKPITDASERVTYLNSKSSVAMTDEQLQTITERVNAIREFIIR